MSARVSISEARQRLPSLVHQVEKGVPIELTRRGRLVAVLVSAADYERLASGAGDLWSAIERFRAETDLSDLDVDAIYGSVRDRSPGRDVAL